MSNTLEEQRIVVVSPMHVPDRSITFVLTPIDVLTAEPDAGPALSGQLFRLLDDALSSQDRSKTT